MNDPCVRLWKVWWWWWRRWGQIHTCTYRKLLCTPYATLLPITLYRVSSLWDYQGTWCSELWKQFSLVVFVRWLDCTAREHLIQNFLTTFTKTYEPIFKTMNLFIFLLYMLTKVIMYIMTLEPMSCKEGSRVLTRLSQTLVRILSVVTFEIIMIVTVCVCVSGLTSQLPTPANTFRLRTAS